LQLAWGLEGSNGRHAVKGCSALSQFFIMWHIPILHLVTSCQFTYFPWDFFVCLCMSVWAWDISWCSVMI